MGIKLGRTLRVVLLGLILAIVGLGLVYGPVAQEALHGAHGYAVKWICSEIYVTGLTPEQAAADLPENPLTPWLRYSVDGERRIVSLSSLGIASRSAIHRPGFGCTLIPPGWDPSDLTPVPPPDVSPVVDPMPAQPSDLVIDPDPANDPTDLDREALRRAVALAFEEPDRECLKNTRAVVVAVGGRLIHEAYAEGFGPDTRLTGWSMTKSWINTLVGIAVHQGRIDMKAPPEIEQWTDKDPRSAVTWDQLLRMSSSLEFEESYSNLRGDAVQMLFVGPDSGGYALDKPLVGPPDSVWNYSSGTTNLISRSLRSLFESHEDYLRFSQNAFFSPLGMTSAIIEPDASGTYVGSSFGWATARDWARFGRLYLQDGVWAGQRLLPEGWVEYTVEPTPKAPNGRYGAHFWLNAGGESGVDHSRPMPKVPADLYYASGFSGQYVVIVPSKNAVIVRLGLSQPPTTWDLEAFLVPVLDALPEAGVSEAEDADISEDLSAQPTTNFSEPAGTVASGSSTT